MSAHAPLRYGSVCSGIEAATVAWHPLGWTPAFFAEIERFPSEVLGHHYGSNLPGETWSRNAPPNLGDMTKFQEWPDADLDVLVGGTPCQDASVGYSAGTGRAGDGFSGARTGLAWCFIEIARRYDPDWIIWENVPNLLGKRHASDFLRFIERIAELGRAVVWRVIDAAAFGLSDQPRPRLFVVAHRRADHARAVLLECEGPFWDCPPIPSAAPVLTARGGMAFDDRTPCILDGGRPRIATPLEWERAMGFPDGYTAIRRNGKRTADGPRYKALGNSMAVNAMRWIGRRIELVDGLAMDTQMEAAE